MVLTQTPEMNIISYFDWHGTAVDSAADAGKLMQKVSLSVPRPDPSNAARRESRANNESIVALQSPDFPSVPDPSEWKDKWEVIDLDDDDLTEAGSEDEVVRAHKERRRSKLVLTLMALLDQSGWAESWEDVPASKKAATSDEPTTAPSEASEAEAVHAIARAIVLDIVNKVAPAPTSPGGEGGAKAVRSRSCFPLSFTTRYLRSCCATFRDCLSFGHGRGVSSKYLKALKTKSNTKQMFDWKKRKMEKQQKEYTEIWLTRILPNWYNLKDDPWVKSSWRQGLPPAIRGLVWPLALGNTLRITEELYQYYTSQASLEMDQDRLSSSLAASARQILDDTSSDVYMRRLKTATKMAMGKEESMMQIEQDIHRTFSSLKLFKPGSDLHSNLRMVLGAYVMYRPDVGYVQGMSYLAGMFLLYMDGPEAFMCLCNLLSRHFFLAFLSADTDHVHKMFGLFNDWFHLCLPALAKHFESINLHPELYLLNWAFTLYVRVLPLDIACLIWDTYMLEGELVIFKTAIALLKVFYVQLLDSSFEQAVKLLIQPPEELDAEIFLKTINNTSVPMHIAEAFESMERKYYAPQLILGPQLGPSPARMRAPSSPAFFARNV